MCKDIKKLGSDAQVEEVNIVSVHPHENPILAKLGFKETNASFGVGTSFESLPVEVVIAEYDEFMERHEGQDWILEGKVSGSDGKVRIK